MMHALKQITEVMTALSLLFFSEFLPIIRKNYRYSLSGSQASTLWVTGLTYRMYCAHAACMCTTLRTLLARLASNP